MRRRELMKKRAEKYAHERRRVKCSLGTQAVAKHFGGVKALHDVSLTIHQAARSTG
jgi:hypothetical protein